MVLCLLGLRSYLAGIRCLKERGLLKEKAVKQCLHKNTILYFLPNFSPELPVPTCCLVHLISIKKAPTDPEQFTLRKPNISGKLAGSKQDFIVIQSSGSFPLCYFTCHGCSEYPTVSKSSLCPSPTLASRIKLFKDNTIPQNINQFTYHLDLQSKATQFNDLVF